METNEYIVTISRLPIMKTVVRIFFDKKLKEEHYFSFKGLFDKSADIYRKRLNNVDFKYRDKEGRFCKLAKQVNAIDNREQAETFLYFAKYVKLNTSVSTSEFFLKLLIAMDYSGNLVIKNDFIFDKDFVELRFVKNVSDYLKFINEQKTVNFYRGHSDINYLLQPTLFREDKLVDKEWAMYSEAMRQYPDVFNKQNTYIDNLTIMQHYNLKTRLLDVTENPLVALFFSCFDVERDCSHGEVVFFSVKPEDIYVFNSNKLETIRKQDGEYCFFLPQMNNRRIINQQGAFILFGGNKPFQYKRAEKQICVIQSNRKKHIIKELERIGITEGFIYPEIDRRMRDINRKYE